VLTQLWPPRAARGIGSRADALSDDTDAPRRTPRNANGPSRGR